MKSRKSVSQQPVRVVIADDDAITRAALRLLLQEQSCVVNEATDGERAIELCAAMRPHIVFLDIDMPKLSGIEAAKQLRELHPDIGIVMVSALSTVDNVQQARQSGASAFVVKPFTPGKLAHAIEDSLRLRKSGSSQARHEFTDPASDVASDTPAPGQIAK